MLSITRRRPTVMAVAGRPTTAVRRVTPCRVAAVHRTEALSADGGLTTAVRPAIPSKAEIARLIEVQSGARRADGTAIELATVVSRCQSYQGAVFRRNFAAELAPEFCH